MLLDDLFYRIVKYRKAESEGKIHLEVMWPSWNKRQNQGRK